MAVCKMEMLAVKRDVGFESVRGRCDASANTQLVQQCVMVRSASSLSSQQKKKRWPSSVVVSAHRVAGVVLPTTTTCAKLRLRCNAASGSSSDNADPPQKGFNISEVVEKVVDEEKDQLPAEQSAPEPLPEGEPSPFSPADENSDDQFTPEDKEEGPPKDSLIMPSKAASTMTTESAASSSIGDGGLGASEQSALAGADPIGGGSAKRDWRVHASNHDLDAIFESEGGNSVDDYKLRAHIFEESAVFFTALKNQEISSLVR